jgi:hypothetical protein
VTGSSYIPIVVPIMAFVAMFFWLGLVFYADSHPGWKTRKAGGATASADGDTATQARSLDAAPGTPPEGAAEVPALSTASEPDHDRVGGDAPVGAGRGVS